MIHYRTAKRYGHAIKVSVEQWKSGDLHILVNEPRCGKNRSSGFPTRFDTNQLVQQQKMAKDLKFRN